MGHWICGRCHTPATRGNRWCANCGASVGLAEWTWSDGDKAQALLAPMTVRQAEPPKHTDRAVGQGAGRALPPSPPPPAWVERLAEEERIDVASDPLLRPDTRHESIPAPFTSRTRGSSVTWDLRGRIVATIIIIVFFIWFISSGLGLLFAPFYLFVMVYMVKEVWRAAQVESDVKPLWMLIRDGINEMRHPPKASTRLVLDTNFACPRCGTSLERAIRWCGTCAAPVSNADLVAALEITRQHSSLQSTFESLKAPPQQSRWQRTATTMGPMGRILSTGLLLIVVVLGSALTKVGAIGGAVIDLAGESVTRDQRFTAYISIAVPICLLIFTTIWRQGAVTFESDVATEEERKWPMFPNPMGSRIHFRPTEQVGISLVLLVVNVLLIPPFLIPMGLYACSPILLGLWDMGTPR